MAGVEAVFTHTQFRVFLEHPGVAWIHLLGMLRIVVTGDVVDGATLSFLKGLILGMDKLGPHGIGRLVIHFRCLSDFNARTSLCDQGLP